MNEKEAYRQFHIEQARNLRWQWALKKLNREIGFLMEELYVRIAKELATTRPGLKVLHAYRGNSLMAWDVSCGVDGRLKKMARNVGWDKFQEIIALARKMETTPESEWTPEWKET